MATSSSLKQVIRVKGDSWNGSTNSGSYTIIFKPMPTTLGVYDGKGGGVTRCNQSANIRCLKNPDIADFQPSPSNFCPATTSYSATDTQAFKEEAIRMYYSSTQNNVIYTDVYNVAQSPGKNYIIQQGY